MHLPLRCQCFICLIYSYLAWSSTIFALEFVILDQSLPFVWKFGGVGWFDSPFNWSDFRFPVWRVWWTIFVLVHTINLWSELIFDFRSEKILSWKESETATAAFVLISASRDFHWFAATATMKSYDRPKVRVRTRSVVGFLLIFFLFLSWFLIISNLFFIGNSIVHAIT